MSLNSSKTTNSRSTMQQSGTSQETSSSRPDVPVFAMQPTENYYGLLSGVGQQMKADPYAYTLPANHLQTKAYNDAQSLGGWQTPLAQSSNLALAAGTSAPNFATATGYTAPKMADAVTFGGASAGPAAQANAQSYNIANLGEAKGYAAPTLGPAAQATAASLLDGGLDRFQNPATQALVDTTLSSFDIDAGRRAAELRRAGAKAGAFGGSEFGVAGAALAGELARGRAATEAGLRSAAFDKATGLAISDADRRQNAGLFNVGQVNDFTKTQAGLDAAANAFKAGADNQFALSRFDADNTSRQWNAGNATDVSKFNAGETNQNKRTDASNQTQAGIASMNAQNQRAERQAELDAAASQFGANAYNDLSKFNAGQTDTALGRALQASGLLAGNAGIFGSNARDDIGTSMDAGNNLWGIQDQYTKAPLTNLAAFGGLLDPSLIAAISGQTNNSWGSSNNYAEGTEFSKQKGNGGLLGTLASIASIGATVASDRRLKRDIERVGELEDGLGVYEYDYVWGGGRQRGVMADEVAQLRPWALGPEIAGYSTVDYGAL